MQSRLSVSSCNTHVYLIMMHFATFFVLQPTRLDKAFYLKLLTSYLSKLFQTRIGPLVLTLGVLSQAISCCLLIHLYLGNRRNKLPYHVHLLKPNIVPCLLQLQKSLGLFESSLNLVSIISNWLFFTVTTSQRYTLQKNPVFHKRAMHIELDCHFTRDEVLEGLLQLSYLPTKHQLANILTILPSPQFRELLSKLGMSLPSPVLPMSQLERRYWLIHTSFSRSATPAQQLQLSSSISQLNYQYYQSMPRNVTNSADRSHYQTCIYTHSYRTKAITRLVYILTHRTISQSCQLVMNRYRLCYSCKYIFPSSS